jgi:hypothetical protein
MLNVDHALEICARRRSAVEGSERRKCSCVLALIFVFVLLRKERACSCCLLQGVVCGGVEPMNIPAITKFCCRRCRIKKAG